MTKDDIIPSRTDVLSMAREVGATPYTNRHYPDRPTHTFNPEQLERFAAIIASRVAAKASAAERKRSEQEMSMMSEHCAELILIEREKVRSSMKKAFRRMAGLIRADEREACAKVCEDDFGNGALNLADAIRARGETSSRGNA